MDAAWEVLERAGVPTGALSETKPDLGDRAKIVAAVRVTLGRADQLSERERVSLFAWLSAWSSGFPRSFREMFTEEGAAILEQAGRGIEDRTRYLKLRRIAREKLLRAL